MKKETIFLTALLVGAVTAIACQSRPESATTPSSTTSAEGSGGVTSSVVTPGGPIGPVPGGPIGPVPGGPIGPVPGGTIGPSPAPGASPASSPIGPNPGSPGGGHSDPDSRNYTNAGHHPHAGHDPHTRGSSLPAEA